MTSSWPTSCPTLTLVPRSQTHLGQPMKCWRSGLCRQLAYIAGPGQPQPIDRDSVMAEICERIKQYEKALIQLPDEKFEAIPPDAFPDGYREKIAKERD